MPPRLLSSGTGHRGARAGSGGPKGSRGRRRSVVGVAPSSATALEHRPQTGARGDPRGWLLGVTGVTLRPVEGCSGSYTLHTKAQGPAQPQPAFQPRG